MVGREVQQLKGRYIQVLLVGWEGVGMAVGSNKLGLTGLKAGLVRMLKRRGERSLRRL